MKETDIQGLRDLGLNDEQILSTVLITCQYNFMTRLANGLGVDISHEKQAAGFDWILGEARTQEWLMAPKRQQNDTRK